jgi:hypothetical protein
LQMPAMLIGRFPKKRRFCVRAPPELIERLAAQVLDTNVAMRPLREQRGEQDTSAAYADFLEKHFVALGFERRRAQPCFFRRVEMRAKIEVHQDDLRCSGEPKMLNWLRQALRTVIELKRPKNFGPGDTYSHLKRYRKRTSESAQILGLPNALTLSLRSWGYRSTSLLPLPS